MRTILAILAVAAVINGIFHIPSHWLPEQVAAHKDSTRNILGGHIENVRRQIVSETEALMGVKFIDARMLAEAQANGAALVTGVGARIGEI